MGFIFQQMYMMKILPFSITSCFRQQKVKVKGKQGGEAGKRRAAYAQNGNHRYRRQRYQRGFWWTASAGVYLQKHDEPSQTAFADEPTGALNRTSSNEVMDELVKLNNKGTTIVMVTHDAKVAAKCGRVLLSWTAISRVNIQV